MKLFKAVNMNWCCHCIGDWTETVYEVSNDGRFKKTIKTSEKPNPDYPDEITDGEFSDAQFTELLALLEEFTLSEAHRNGCDGEGWEMTLYGQHGKIIHRTVGYIYGDKLLEAVAALMP